MSAYRERILQLTRKYYEELDKEDFSHNSDHVFRVENLAKRIAEEEDVDLEVVEAVCHAIYTHRRSKDREPQSLEARILRDADYLDAMGAVDVARVFSSALCSRKYGKPIYVDKPYEEGDDPDLSAIHFMLYKINHPKHQPENFCTETGRKLAVGRFEFMKEYAERFIDEWHGER